jgi:hypothetical protein
LFSSFSEYMPNEMDDDDNYNRSMQNFTFACMGAQLVMGLGEFICSIKRNSVPNCLQNEVDSWQLNRS